MGKQQKQWQTLFLGVSKSLQMVTALMKLKDACLLLERKVMTNLDIILKSRDITLPTKVCLVKAMVFPAVLYGCESWTIKKAESWRMDAFELWCWRRLLRVPWTAGRSNQSILKKNQPEYFFFLSFFFFLICSEFCHTLKWNQPEYWRTDAEAETPILWPPVAKNWLIWKDPDAGKDWRQEEKGTTEADDRETTGWNSWMASPTQWTWIWVNSRSWWWTGRPGVLKSMGSQRVGHNWVTELNWAEVSSSISFFPLYFFSFSLLSSCPPLKTNLLFYFSHPPFPCRCLVGV